MTVTKKMTTAFMPSSRDDSVSLGFLTESVQYIKGRLLPQTHNPFLLLFLPHTMTASPGKQEDNNSPNVLIFLPYLGKNTSHKTSRLEDPYETLRYRVSTGGRGSIKEMWWYKLRSERCYWYCAVHQLEYQVADRIAYLPGPSEMKKILMTSTC